MMTWGKEYWPVFLLISTAWIATGFGIPEGFSLASDPSKHLDNTLSYYARTQLHANIAVAGGMHTVAWWATFVLWMIFVIFITAHIWFAEFG